MATNAPLAPYISSVLTANGGSNGTLTVASTQPFRLGARVWLRSDTLGPVELIIDEIISTTVLAVRDATSNNFNRFAANAYTTVGNAVLVQNIQPDYLALNWT